MPSADQVPVNNNTHSMMRWHEWVVPIAGSTGPALRAVRPQPSHHAVCPARSRSPRKRDRISISLTLGHHGPGHPRGLVGEYDGGDLGRGSSRFVAYLSSNVGRGRRHDRELAGRGASDSEGLYPSTPQLSHRNPKPVTPAQLLYAKKLAQGKGLIIPDDARTNSAAMSAWIDKNRDEKRRRLKRETSNGPVGSVAPQSTASPKRSRTQKLDTDAASMAAVPANSISTPLRIPCETRRSP
jgi:hypothetical protein